MLPETYPPQIKIFGSAPSIDGRTEDDPTSTGSVYLSFSIAGTITLLDAITLSGQVTITVSSEFVEIAAIVSTNVKYIGSMAGSLHLKVYTDHPAPGNALPGVVGRVVLTLDAGGAIPGSRSRARFCSRSTSAVALP